MRFSNARCGGVKPLAKALRCDTAARAIRRPSMMR
jgi:hypothetical protein